MTLAACLLPGLLAIGMMGVLAAKKLDRLVAFSVIGSMGMVMVSHLAVHARRHRRRALLHCALHVGGRALFLIADLVRTGAGDLI